MKEVNYWGEPAPTHPPHPTSRSDSAPRSFAAPQPRFFKGDQPLEFLDEDFAAQELRPIANDDEDDHDSAAPAPIKRRRQRHSLEEPARNWERVDEFLRMVRDDQ